MTQTERILAKYQYLGSLLVQIWILNPCGAHLYGSPQLQSILKICHQGLTLMNFCGYFMLS